jgi:MraZ protein
MTMFRGFFEHTINPQGRVSLPAKFRQVLEVLYSKKLVLVALPDRIEAYPEEVFRKQEKEDIALPADDPRVLEYLVMRHANVWEVDIDGQGRMLMPPKIKQDNGLEKGVIFVGLMDRILIFNPEQWETFSAGARERHQENSLLVSRLKRSGGEPVE